MCSTYFDRWWCPDEAPYAEADARTPTFLVPPFDLRDATVSARTGDDRLAEIQAIFDSHFTERLRTVLTPDVVAAIEAKPLGPHDDRCARVVRAFANAPIAGKLVILSLGPNGPWGIGEIAIGVPGNLILLPEAFDTHEDAARQIFIRRKDAFMTSLSDPTSKA